MDINVDLESWQSKDVFLDEKIVFILSGATLLPHWDIGGLFFAFFRSDFLLMMMGLLNVLVYLFPLLHPTLFIPPFRRYTGEKGRGGIAQTWTDNVK